MLQWVPGSCTRTIRRCRVAHPLWVRRPPGENPRYGSRSVVASPDVHCGPGVPVELVKNTVELVVIDGDSLCCQHAADCCHRRRVLWTSPHHPYWPIDGYGQQPLAPRAVNPASLSLHWRRAGSLTRVATRVPTRPAGRTRQCCRRTWRASPSGRNPRCAAREPSSRRPRISRRGGCPNRRRSGRRSEGPHD